MSHTVTSYAGFGNLDTASVADHTSVSDLLILSAVALPVLAGSEDLFAEKTVLFGLECPVIDCFRLGNLTS